MKFKILSQQSITNNTAEFGFGDYRETKLSLSAIIDSETERKAKSIFKKEFDKSAKFNGHSPSHIIVSKFDYCGNESNIYKKY